MSKVLIIAPHPDDEIIGVGGTAIKHITKGNEVSVCIVTKGCMPLFSEESVQQVRSETLCCHESLGVNKTFFLDYPAAMLETIKRYELNDKLMDVIKEIEPDEVYIPHIGDMQKDHQIVVDAAMVALRPKYSFAPRKILTYETLSETGWNIPNVQNDFIPNVYVDIGDCLDKKLELMKQYQSQISNYPNARSIEAVKALSQYRGALMNMRAAEAFMLIREIN